MYEKRQLNLLFFLKNGRHWMNINNEIFADLQILYKNVVAPLYTVGIWLILIHRKIRNCLELRNVSAGGRNGCDLYKDEPCKLPVICTWYVPLFIMRIKYQLLPFRIMNSQHSAKYWLRHRSCDTSRLMVCHCCTYIIHSFYYKVPETNISKTSNRAL